MAAFADVANAAGGWATVVLALLGLGGTLLAGHRWAKRNVAEPLKQIPVLQMQVSALQIDLTAVKGEVTTNSGKSLKDETKRNGLAIAELQATVTAIHQAQA